MFNCWVLHNDSVVEITTAVAKCWGEILKALLKMIFYVIFTLLIHALKS